MSLDPSDGELRAIRRFVSSDETRPNLATLWVYESDDGITHFASDGHTMCVRRSGTHRAMESRAVAALPSRAIDLRLPYSASAFPPPWPLVLVPGQPGKLAERYGFNPRYVARVGTVEDAAGRRAADDFIPSAGMSKKAIAQARSRLRESVFASWVVPSDALGGWYWKMDVPSALWEGVIMPRRV